MVGQVSQLQWDLFCTGVYFWHIVYSSILKKSLFQSDSEKIEVYTSFTKGGYTIGEEAAIVNYLSLKDTPEGKNTQEL